MADTTGSGMGANQHSRDSSPLPDQQALLEARVAYLRSRRQKLEDPSGRAGVKRWVNLLTPSITALVAIGGLMWTVYGSNRERAETRMNQALNGLGARSASVRAVSVNIINGFMTRQYGHNHRMLLNSLASTLALEDDPVVREAIRGVFRDIAVAEIAPEVLETSLSTLISGSRSLVASQHLRVAVLGDPKSSEPSLPLSRAIAIGDSIVDLLRKGVAIPGRDLSGIYCVQCDFEGLRTSLADVTFRHALLSFAKFQNVNVVGANFDSAVLEGVDFTGANLHAAQLTYRDPGTPPAMEELGLVEPRIMAPIKFQCANLSEAHFDGQLLFVVVPTRLRETVRELAFAEFAGANLSDTGLHKLSWLLFDEETPMGGAFGDYLDSTPNGFMTKAHSSLEVLSPKAMMLVSRRALGEPAAQQPDRERRLQIAEFVLIGADSSARVATVLPFHIEGMAGSLTETNYRRAMLSRFAVSWLKTNRSGRGGASEYPSKWCRSRELGLIPRGGW